MFINNVTNFINNYSIQIISFIVILIIILVILIIIKTKESFEPHEKVPMDADNKAREIKLKYKLEG